ncbi:MAG: TSUP family transporter [Bacteroidota bacterium]
MLSSTIIVCIASFIAGFVDAIVGGGGLIQTPVLLMSFPSLPVASLLGTTKIPSFSGTAVSLYQYSKRVTINWKLIIWIAAAAFAASMLGSMLVTIINNELLKPIILIALAGVAVYTYSKKNFGQQEAQEISFSNALIRGVTTGLLIGFYDGFIGPGTGSFLVLMFVGLLGNDFLHASAHAKTVNLATNIASIIYFASTGNIIYELAVPMALFNMTGGFIGSRLALLKGNTFIRIFFLLVVIGTIIRFAFDIF